MRKPIVCVTALAALSAGALVVACSGVGALQAPSNVTATPMAGGVHVIWNDNSDGEDGFEVERKSNGDYALITTTAFDTNQFHDETVAAQTTYSYRVRAVKGGDKSAYSNEATVTTPAAGSGGDTDAGTGNGGNDGGMDAGTTTDGGTLVSFRNQVVPIILNSCGTGSSSCHSRDAYAANQNMNCRGWLALEDTALGSVVYAGPTAGQPTGCPDRTLYQRLVDLTGWMCDNPQRKYVVAGDPNSSLIFHVIGTADPSFGGTCRDGSNMPLQAMPKALPALSAADVTTIKTWIEQGAQDN